MNHIKSYQAASLAAFQQLRSGETRLGETLFWPAADGDFNTALKQAKTAGVRFVILGIPEDIGPRGNLGNGGADLGFTAFLKRFLNLQANPFVDGSGIWIAGEIHCDDLQQQSQSLDVKDPVQLAALRALCAQVDERVTPVVQAIFAAGLLPIVIGGGHNNALPILQALAQQTGAAVNAVNLDPHCDFRLLEGRHSGNGFSYAKAQQWLDRYFVVGLHELKNSAAALRQMQQAGVGFCSYQDIYLRQNCSFEQSLQLALDYFNADQPNDLQHSIATPLGIELDTDSISMMPVSAFTNCGVTVSSAERYVYYFASLPQSRYLHLAEAAPSQHPAGLAAGMSEAGQVLTALVLAFIQAKTAISN
ncbi:arginase [Rheinheimera sp. SA_1]|uniref:formimidoylglutamase n=1 Tax=Rheinheimera sp. SA_1 TaxID=1827365 RepID=UPI0008020D0A|nr:formimidoylglutamase [Rheinheimera sp. SA_1]OBP16426.1 arginase [Rheinheimera sp. SA_1]